jgi:purine-binding chemotaxis protein CheW
VTDAIAIDDTALHVVCSVGDETYALPAAQVLELETFAGATAVPGTPPWVVGLVQVRSRVVPAVDLRLRLGLPPAPRTLDTRVLVVQLEGRVIGLIADAAREMVHLDAAVAPLPALDDRAHVRGAVQVGARRYLLIDLESLLGQE